MIRVGADLHQSPLWAGREEWWALVLIFCQSAFLFLWRNGELFACRLSPVWDCCKAPLQKWDSERASNDFCLLISYLIAESGCWCHSLTNSAKNPFISCPQSPNLTEVWEIWVPLYSFHSSNSSNSLLAFPGLDLERGEREDSVCWGHWSVACGLKESTRNLWAFRMPLWDVRFPHPVDETWDTRQFLPLWKAPGADVL